MWSLSILSFGIILLSLELQKSGFLGSASAYVLAPPTSEESLENFQDYKNVYPKSFNWTSQELNEIGDEQNEIWNEDKNHVDDIQPAASGQSPQFFNLLGSNDLESSGQTLTNFFQNVASRISQTSRHVNRTLGNLNAGIETGSSTVQNFISNFLERKSTTLVSLVERISNFFNTTIGIVRAIFGALSRGFHQLIGGLFNRDRGLDSFTAATSIATEDPTTTSQHE